MGRKLVVFFALAVALYAAFVSWASAPVVSSGSVVVTGVSSGIGRHAAFYLAENGFHVFGTFRKDSDRASLLEEAQRRGVGDRFFAVRMDISKAESVEAGKEKVLKEIATKQLPALYAVVQNAGISGGGSPLELNPDDRLRWVMEVNFFGALNVVKTFLPAIRATRGRIVSISSLKGSIAVPGSSGYNAAKAGLDMAMRCLQREVLHLGVRVVTVQPGYILTDNLVNVDTKFVEEQSAMSRQYVDTYPGFRRYMQREFESKDKPGRGVSALVTSEAIHSAIVARFPFPVIRAGGREVISATWVPRLIPDVFQDFVAATVFRYGEPIEEAADKTLLAKIKKYIGG